MPNRKMLRAAAGMRQQMRPEAERLYRQHRDQVPRLIRQLAGPTQAEHDHAFELLSQMNEMMFGPSWTSNSGKRMPSGTD